DCRGTSRALDFEKDIKKPFDEQRGISFKNFVDDAAHFKTGSKTVQKAIDDTGSQLNTLYGTWTGKAADASSENYNEKILPKAKKLSETLNNASEATLHTTATVFKLCKGKADTVIDLYKEIVGKADFAMAQKVIAIAAGEKSGKEDLGAIAGWMDVNFGSNLVQQLNNDGCCDDDEFKKAGQNLAKQWIQNQFIPEMWTIIYEGFAKSCKETKDFVNQAYDELDKVMGKVKNEFEGAGDKGGAGGAGGTGGGPGGKGPDFTGGQGGGPGGGPGGSGTGGGPGGSGTGGGPGGGGPEGGTGGGPGGSGKGPDFTGGTGGGPGGGGPEGGSGGGPGAGGSGPGGSGTGPTGDVKPPPVPDVKIPESGSGTPGGPGGGLGGGPDANKDQTSPSSSTPPPSNGDEQKAAAEEAKKQAAAAAENAKKQASEALGKLGDGPTGTDLGGSGGSGPGGSGPGGGPGGGGNTDAAAEAKAAAEKAGEEAKKQASDALNKLGDAPGGMGDANAEDGDSKDGEKAADEAKKKASDALDKLGDELSGDDKLAGDKPAGDKPGEDGDKAEDGERETLKVKQGDTTFEMTEPDKDGEMEIKVGDGSGPAKDFKLDWTGEGDDSKLGSTPGSDDGKPDKDGVHRPGPDGKIHIQDGDVKITAERPDGPSGPTVVTVDDGTGKPTTYTLGEDKPSSDKASHPATPVTGTAQPDAKPVFTPHHGGGGTVPDGVGGGGGFGGGGGASAPSMPFETASPATGQSLSEGVHTGGGGTPQPQPVASGAPSAPMGSPSGQSFGGGAMPPMGMGAGGGGGQGGDQERTNRAYRIEGEVFDQINEPTGRITGSLLDDEDQSVTRKR
ncbi:WXG100 family type VII secretion target, partial [Amycolatopsis lurida]|uniref:WXG100 family type VII secretion target n=1 Tax=Amycolatopsis lurida TaxID=31959 RepID=UPI0036672C54